MINRSNIGSCFWILVLLLLMDGPVNGQRGKLSVDIPTGGPFRFNRFCAPSSSTIWSVAGGGYVYSDGADGRHEYKLSDESIAVYADNFGRVWVTGMNGAIYHSDDNGSTWLRQASGVKSDLKTVTCVDRLKCWAAGDQNVVLHTYDGGAIWHPVKIGLEIPDAAYHSWNAIDFVDANIGWIAGDSGIILHTVNGGRHWSLQQASIIPHKDRDPTPNHINAVKFINSQLGWVCAWGGVARTTDGGNSWQVVLSEPEATKDNDRGELTFIGIISHDIKTVWVVGDESSPNYCSQDGGQTWRPCEGKSMVDGIERANRRTL